MPKFGLPGLSSKLPADLRQFLERVGEFVRAGVTRDELIERGIAKTNSRGELVPTDSLDYTPPPPPENLQASGSMTSIILTWDAPAGYANFSHAEVWRSATNDIGAAVLNGTTPAAVYSDAVGSDATFYYWVRFVSKASIAGPYNGTPGTMGQTAPDPAYVIEQLAGQITSSELHTDLNARINLIDATGTGLVDRAGVLETWQTATAPRLDLIDTTGTGLVDRTDALETWKTSADSRLDLIDTPTTGLVDRVVVLESVALEGVSADVTAERIARVSEDDALAAQTITAAAQFVTSDGTVALAAVQAEQLARAEEDSAVAWNVTEVAGQLTTDLSVTQASVLSEQAIRVTEDSAIAATATALAADLTTSDAVLSAAVTSEQVARVADDGALAGVQSLLSAQQSADLSVTTASVLSEQQARVTEDGALAWSNTNITAELAAGVNAAAAGVLVEQAARVTEDSAVAAVAVDVSAQLTTADAAISASVVSEQQARVTDDTALAAQQTGLAATLATTEATLSASVVSEQQSRVEDGSALAGAYQQLAAQMASDTSIVSAAITAEQVARTSADSALTTTTQTLSARIANASRMVFQETWDDPNALSRWTNHSGLGEMSIQSVSDATVGGKVLRVGDNSGNDQVWLIHNDNIPFDPNLLYKVTVRVRRTAGAGTVYLGWAGVAADGVTLVNSTGSNTIFSQHYQAASGQSPGASWTTYTGYTKGTAATGQSGSSSTPSTPYTMHQNARYIRPLILVNYLAVPGTTEVGSFQVEISEAQYADAAASAAVTTEAIARVNEDGALAAASSVLAAEMTSANGVVAAGLTSEQQARVTEDSAVATQIDQVSSTVAGNTATIQSQATSINGLSAQYSLKIDNNGFLSGWGLSSELSNATPFSQFIFQADRFSIINPNVAPATVTITRSGSTATVTHTAHGRTTGDYVVIAGANEREYNGTRQITVTGSNNYTYTVSGTPATPATGTIKAGYASVPFIVDSGKVIMDAVFIKDGAITNAKIGDAAITNAKVSDLNASKINAGTLDADRIGANSITASKIASYTITATEIAAATITGDRIAANTVTAGNIDSRGLSIKDALGNILFASGTPLTAQYITPDAGWLNTNVTGFNALVGGHEEKSYTGTGYGFWSEKVYDAAQAESLNRGIYPSDVVTLSADVMVDAARAAAGGQVAVYVYWTNAADTWISGAVFVGTTSTYTRKSVTTTIGASASKIYVALYHYPSANDVGTSYARRIKLERGASATLYSVGATANVTTSGTLAARPVGANGDFYYATDLNILYQKIAGSWINSANYVDPAAEVGNTGEVFNGNCTIAGVDGRPAGVYAMYGTSDPTVVSFQDAAKSIVNLYSASDSSIGCAFSAFRVVPGTTYNIFIRIKSNAAAGTGSYFRMFEYDSELAVGVKYIHNGTGEAGGVTCTRQNVSFRENVSITTSWQEFTYTYTPTSTAKWVSPVFLNWDGMGTSELHIDKCIVVSNATVGAPAGTYVGTTLAQTVESNSANGATAFTDTATYRTAGAPTNVPSPALATVKLNSNATADIRVNWGAYTHGTNPADMLLLFWRRDGLAPTINDAALAFNVNTTGPSYAVLEGVAPDGLFSFGLAAARRTKDGFEIGTIQTGRVLGSELLATSTANQAIIGGGTKTILSGFAPDGSPEVQLVDSSTGAYQAYMQSTGIARAASDKAEMRMWVKKDAVSTRVALVRVSSAAGTTAIADLILRTDTGAKTLVTAGAGTVVDVSEIYDYDGWWLCHLVVTFPSGTTSWRAEFFPAPNTALNGSYTVAATGTTVIGNWSMKLVGSGSNSWLGLTGGTPNFTANVAGTSAATLALNASTALTNANTANNLLADIASDAKLTPTEKLDVRREWDIVASEKAGINAQATALGITTENTTYNTAFQTLANYLHAGTWTSGAPSWISDANLSTTTDIVGATFRSNWKTMYDARQALLNKMAAQAALKASWAQVTARPAELDILNSNSGFTSHTTWEFTNTLDGWTAANATTVLNANYLRFTATTGSGSTLSRTGLSISGSVYNKVRIRLRAVSVEPGGAPLTLKYSTAGHGASTSYYKEVYLPDLTTFLDWFVVELDMADLTAGGTDWISNTITGLTFEPTLFAGEIWEIDWLSVGRAGAPISEATIGTNVIKAGGGVAAASDFVAAWNKMTAANATTFIDNAAIGTAQIANAAITTALINDLAVNTAKLNDAAVTTAKIGDAQITTAKIADAQITNAKIGDAAITSAKIGDAQITTAKINDLSVNGAKITGVVSGSVYLAAGASTTITTQSGRYPIAVVYSTFASNGDRESGNVTINNGSFTITNTSWDEGNITAKAATLNYAYL